MNKYIGPDNILKKKNEFMYPNSHHFYKDPPQMVKGYMQYLYDHTGKEYLDFFAGVSVINCGHCNPYILEGTIKQLSTLQHTTNIYLTEPIVNLAEKLAGVFPGNIDTSFFCLSGSEANEGAMILARLHTNKEKFIFFNGGLHGRTFLTTAVTGVDMWRIDPFYNDAYIRCNNHMLDKELTTEDAAKLNLNSIKDILEKYAHEIAALIVEPIQGNAGIITPPLWYFKELKELLKSYDVLMIVDEVQTGFARTGKMFAIENFDTVPDIITCAKALGNGIPISAFASSSELAKSFTKPSASTLGGNPVASATAIKVLEYIENEDLIANSYELGAYLKEKLEFLRSKFSFIHEVRGLGLMLGMEIVQDGKACPDLVDMILEQMMKLGFIIGKNGINRNVLAFQPPLVINRKNIDDMTESLEKVFKSIIV
ncbi:MAG: aspartate aminotransferase family protein [Acidaminobacteraceae bacterium]